MATTTATPRKTTSSKSARSHSSRTGARTFTPAFGAIKTVNGQLMMVGQYELAWQPSAAEAQAMITQLQQYIGRISGGGTAKRPAGK
jgi:hypothetical protein